MFRVSAILGQKYLGQKIVELWLLRLNKFKHHPDLCSSSYRAETVAGLGIVPGDMKDCQVCAQVRCHQKGVRKYLLRISLMNCAIN